MNDEPTITCGRCSATSSFDRWKGPAGAELPSNRFQCPQCHWAFERRAGRNKWGQHVITLVTVNAELPLAGGHIR